MTDRVIEEVDEKLEGDIGSKKKIIQVNSIYNQLSSTKRQVNKLIGGLRQYASSVPAKKEKEEEKTQEISKPYIQKPDNKIGKYNYYGKRYRFEEKQEELNIEPAKVQRQCVSEINFQNKSKPNPSPKTEKNIAKSQIAVMDESIFFDDGQIKMPSHNYHIIFDEPSTRKKQSKIGKVPAMQIPSSSQKFKPAWFMQKKINSLQRQLKQMKDREKRRYHDQSLELKAMRNTYDGPIKLKSNIERMVESLWR